MHDPLLVRHGHRAGDLVTESRHFAEVVGTLDGYTSGHATARHVLEMIAERPSFYVVHRDEARVLSRRAGLPDGHDRRMADGPRNVGFCHETRAHLLGQHRIDGVAQDLESQGRLRGQVANEVDLGETALSDPVDHAIVADGLRHRRAGIGGDLHK